MIYDIGFKLVVGKSFLPSIKCVDHETKKQEIKCSKKLIEGEHVVELSTKILKEWKNLKQYHRLLKEAYKHLNNKQYCLII